jgi:DoxX-like family
MSAVAVQVHDATRWKRGLVLAGRIVGGLGVVVVLSSVSWKLTADPEYVQEWGRIGYSVSALRGIGLLQLTCVVLYLIPQTAVLGTVLLTGYLGGAIASYVRIGELFPPLTPLSTCLLLWAGLYLREERLQSLLPLRKKTGP